ncbi:MAG: hypothetical protein WBK67_02085 [Minisyncoccales bacterium]|jgi:hypothetical protein
MSDKTDNKIISVPQQVFDQFLKELGTQKVSEEVIGRLKKTLMDEGRVSVEVLKAALFSDGNIKT